MKLAINMLANAKGSVLRRMAASQASFLLDRELCTDRLMKFDRNFLEIYTLIKLTISSSKGLTAEGKNSFSSPFSSIRYLQKFQVGSLSFHPLRSLSDSHRYNGCLSTPFTEIF